MNRTVISFNIRRYRKLLESETDGAKRRTIIQLLAEEQEKMKALDAATTNSHDVPSRQCVKCGSAMRLLTQSGRFRAPRDHVLTSYFGCVRCVDIQTHDRVTPVVDHLDDILRLVMAEAGATHGHLQLLDPRRQTLSITVQSGFDTEFLDHFREVSAADSSVTGRALRERRRIIIDDIEMGLSASQIAIARDRDVRAFQSTPLIGSDRRIAGMISTHFDKPHRPSEGEFGRMARHVERAFNMIG
ncbi:MAG: GAF domain-containing protein [Pseudolabrys sp.]|nr:GAF domain-containing protein [Pseudolabrys sp.]